MSPTDATVARPAPAEAADAPLSEESGDRSTRVLGRLLVARGDASPEQVAAALREQQHTRERLGSILIRQGLSAECVARALAAQLRLSFVEAPLVPQREATVLVERELALRLRAVPLSLRDGVLRVAMVDPLDAGAIDDLQFRTGRRVEPMVAAPAAVSAGLAAAYDADEVDALLGRVTALRSDDADTSPDALDALQRASEARPIVALVDLLLARAVAARASDLHVEPGREQVRVRARVDGVLRELVRLPAHVGAAVVSRIKVAAGLDISVKRRPQDGRYTHQVDGAPLVLRVSTLPSVAGEKTVLRLLRESPEARSLDELGLGSMARRRLGRMLRRSHGLLLVTGPTGSGKTTTLYAALAGLDRSARNIVTLEEPVEYRLQGVTQVQVQPRAGLSFVTALRAVLRQDPDVIMVGEMRDRETVEVGLAAALTGHLVLSTLHTNDAASAVTRLVEMGAPPHLIAGGLIGVVAQRLVRRRCTACDGPGRRPRCSRCGGSGFRGRVGVFEVLAVDEAVRALVLQRASTARVRRLAVRRGMQTLAQDAAEKVRAGLSTQAEIAGLVSADDVAHGSCPDCGAVRRARFVRCPACGRVYARRCACGERLQPDWRWCAACGRPAGGDGGGASTAGA